MNKKFVLLVLSLTIVLLVSSSALMARSELVVEWADPATGEVIVDALRNAIVADSLRPDDRVYVLRKGGFYWITETITNDGWPLRIEGEEPGPTELENPAVLQMVARPDGSVNGRIITGGGDITLKNLYILGNDDSGVQTYYQPIQIDASNSRFIFDNIILERTNFALIAFTAKNNDIFFTNCKFRNLIGKPSTQQWEGRGISIWADQDTVVVENCTFFNIGMTAFQLEGGAANYVRFNHNTLVNVGRSINAGNWWKEAYFANNLIINGFWHGEGARDFSNPSRDPRATSTGLFTVGALPSAYGPEQGRRVLFANSASWRDPAFATFYGDSIATQYFINPVTAQDFFDVYENMVIKDTLWLDTMPNIGTYTDDIIDDMIQNISDLRANNLPAHPYFWRLPEDPVTPGEVCAVCPSWPLPENFAYTDANLMTAGTDNLPLGDLNWFPDKKAEYEANKAQYIEDLKNMAGPVKVYEVVDEMQAEDGTLGGDAVVEEFQGFSYFQMDGGGYLEWTFELPVGGQYDLAIWTHMRGNAMRGTHTIINGVGIHDVAHGWGELIYDNASGVTAGMEINDWTWVRWTQADIKEAGALTFPAGTNTIRLEKSWGWQNFAGVDLYEPGTNNVVISLRAADVTAYEIVMPRGEGAPWTPLGFRSVALGANGSVSLNLEAPSDGNYTLQVFYQNYMGDTNLNVQADGVDVLILPVVAAGDSTGLNVLSDAFPLTAGVHAITLSGGNVKIDFVQLIKETILTKVDNREKLPDGYALSQNYPNPFNPSTNIEFSIAKAGHVKLEVFNVLGQNVATLVDQKMAPGSYRYTWNAINQPTGLYFYTWQVDDLKVTRKMMLVK